MASSNQRFRSQSHDNEPHVPVHEQTTPTIDSSGVEEMPIFYQVRKTILFFARLDAAFLDPPRLSIFQSAANLSTAASDAAQSPAHDADLNLGDEQAYPSAEVLETMINWRPKTKSTAYILSLQGVLSSSSIESQGLALICRNVYGSLRAQYVVSINYAAWTITSAKIAESSESLRRNLFVHRDRYARNIVAGLQYISVADLPSVPLLQALLSGAMFAHSVGCFERCWHLTAAASRVCLALGADALTANTRNSNDVKNSEIRRCVVLCYMLDKALSLSMSRTSMFPTLTIAVSSLAPYDIENPILAISNINLELSKIQDSISSCTNQLADYDARLLSVRNLLLSMDNIKIKIEKARAMSQHHHFWKEEWCGVSFAFHATMTCILCLHPCLTEDMVMRQQVAHARESLESLRNMISFSIKSTEGFALKASISWKFSFYTLCPFLAAFRNVIRNFSSEDYNLLSDVIHRLTAVSWVDEPITRFLPFLTSLLGLCRQLFFDQPGFTDASPFLNATSTPNPTLNPSDFLGDVVEDLRQENGFNERYSALLSTSPALLETSHGLYEDEGSFMNDICLWEDLDDF